MRKIQDFIDYWKFSDEDRVDDYWKDIYPKEERRTDSTIYFWLSVLEIPFIIICWIDYYWNLIAKTLASTSLIFVIPSILTTPITIINGFILTSFIYLKENVIGHRISFKEAVIKNHSRFPEL
mgnify:CR=1 FL=1|tara:strand:+ start:321 stop:689 length:369 start_codon:yes stop_codon:yes gene_type:complete